MTIRVHKTAWGWARRGGRRGRTESLAVHPTLRTERTGPLQPAGTRRHRAMARVADTRGEGEPVATSGSISGWLLCGQEGPGAGPPRQHTQVRFHPAIHWQQLGRTASGK